MQIVNFQCGKCGKLMGVSAEHLGTQVHCPHCHEIVEAPQPVAVHDPFADVRVEIPDSKEQESIFTNPEDVQSEDLFGGPAKSLVELPPKSAPRHAAGRDQAPMHHRDPEPRRAAPFAEPRAATTPPDTAESPPVEGADSLAPSNQAPRPAKSSMFGPMLLVLLIPYALLTTVYIIWGLLHTRDPLEFLRDTGKDGSPRRVSPDRPLPAKLKTSLKLPIRVGALEVTPLKVELNHEGDLVLLLKMTNASQDQAFCPIHDSYLHYSETSRKSPRPYTYLDAGPQVKLYGGYLRFLNEPAAKDEDPQKGVVGPGQSVYVEIITEHKYRDDKVKTVMRSPGPVVWRVQFRRGFVALRNRDVSATAVIGVEFSTNAVEKTKA